MEFSLFLIFTLLNVFLWFVFFGRLKKTYSPNKILEKIRIEVDKLLIEINRETDQDLILLENKINSLKQVIEIADRRLGVLVNEEERKNAVVSVEQQVDKIQNEVKSNTYTLEAKKALKHNNQKKQNSTISLFPAEEIVVTKVPLKDQVIELYKSNIDEALIAERLNVTIAEVQMIVSVYGNI